MGAARDDACLLLPSSLGLLEYDLLEGATFVGASPAGGLEARPTPFARARVVLTRTEAGHVARLLPGVDDVTVDDAPPREEPLGHGARVRIGSEIAVFHAATPPPAAPAGRPRQPVDAPTRDAAPRPPRPVPVWPLALLAAGMFLAAVVRALEHVQAAQRADDVLTRSLPEPSGLASVTLPDDVRTALELDASGRNRGDDAVSASIDRYRAALERTRDPAVAATLRARLEELHEALAAVERTRMETQAGAAVAAGAFERALEVVRAYERRFTGTAAAAGVDAWRPRIQREAAVALDVLLRDIAPLIVHAPRDAFVRLLDALDRFPVE